MLALPFREGKWDAKQWKEDFERYSGKSTSQNARSIIRFMRQEAFLHTVYVVRKGSYISENGKQIQFPDSTKTTRQTRLYAEKLSAPKSASGRTVVRVENIDCLVAAQRWKEKGYRTAVLNMASRQNPGGGVYAGAGAQEENLFQRTNLFQSTYRYAPYAEVYGVKMICRGYPLDRNFGGVFSPDVTVFRGLEKDGYPLLDEPFSFERI